MLHLKIPRDIVDTFLDKDSILTGRISLYLRGVLSSNSYPIQYYGKEFTKLNFLKCMGTVEGVKYEKVLGRRHVPIEISAALLIDDYIDTGAGIQEFDELLEIMGLYDNPEKILHLVKSKDKFLEILEEWKYD